MAESLLINPAQSRQEQYESLLPQITALIEGEPDPIANLANISAALKQTFNWLWIGFYLVKDTELVLGPFQGPIACTRIAHGRGVCGTAWQEARTIVVQNVDEFPGHIACSSESRSEIVIPILKDQKVIGVLDADSKNLSDFDQTDARFLEQLCTQIGSFL